METNFVIGSISCIKLLRVTPTFQTFRDMMLTAVVRAWNGTCMEWG